MTGAEVCPGDVLRWQDGRDMLQELASKKTDQRQKTLC